MSKISTVSFIMMLKKKVLHVTFYVITDDINFFGNPPETELLEFMKKLERESGESLESLLFSIIFFSVLRKIQAHFWKVFPHILVISAKVLS